VSGVSRFRILLVLGQRFDADGELHLCKLEAEFSARSSGAGGLTWNVLQT
jgi:hypothetical protein